MASPSSRPHWLAINYREAYGLHASCGIMFNHESPVRGETFVTRKITRSAAAIAAGIEDKLYLGNLDAIRDWGHAKEYVQGMWLMLQQDEPGDYVLATGRTASVREFAGWAFEDAGMPIDFTGEGVGETGVCRATGRTLIEIDPRYFRPTEVDILCGDPGRARRKLGVGTADLRPRSGARDGSGRYRGPAQGAAVSKYSLERKRVYVAGDRGMVGGALVRRLAREACDILTAPRNLDLRNQSATNAWFEAHRPDAVFLAAARVGGILANSERPGGFLYENIMIAANVIEAARRGAVGKLMFLGSSCIYPKHAPQPLAENALLTGPLEETNESLCHRQDRGRQAGRCLSPAVRMRLRQRHAGPISTARAIPMTSPPAT